MQGRVDLRAVSGDISVGIRRGSRVFVDANTVSGSTSSEVELGDAPGGGEVPAHERRPSRSSRRRSRATFGSSARRRRERRSRRRPATWHEALADQGACGGILDFLKLWSAETVSQFGTQFTQLALPLAAIDVLHASAFEVAALTTVEFLPFLLVSLPAGVWVDRLRRRPILVIGDLARAALLASVPIAYAFDALTIWQLYVVGFTVGIATVFFDVAYQSYLPRWSTARALDRRQLEAGDQPLRRAARRPGRRRRRHRR